MLAGVGLSAVSWLHSNSAARHSAERVKALEAELEAARHETRTALDELRAEIRDIERPPQIELLPMTPRPGMNLAKRTQVLRMHRLGEAPEKIATTLKFPLQEVQLLLKVHRIVISSI